MSSLRGTRRAADQGSQQSTRVRADPAQSAQSERVLVAEMGLYVLCKLVGWADELQVFDDLAFTREAANGLRQPGRTVDLHPEALGCCISLVAVLRLVLAHALPVWWHTEMCAI